MKSLNKLLLVLMAIIAMSVTSCKIESYTTRPIEIQIELVNRTPSSMVESYDTELANSWVLTYSRCTQLKEYLDQEIDLRSKRQGAAGKVLSGIGASAGFASALYAIIDSEPSPIAIGTLGIFSGGVFATSFAFTKTDERLQLLLDKSKVLEALKVSAEQELTELERLIANKNLLIAAGKTDIHSDKDPDPEILEAYKEIEQQIIDLRNALSKWDNEAK